MLAKHRAQNANDIAAAQRNNRFEYFLLYFSESTKHTFQSAKNICRGILCYKSFPCNIRGGIFAGVSRISRNRMRDELERFPKRRGARPSRPHHVSLRSPRRRAGKPPGAFRHSLRTSEGPQTCSTSSHNTWTGGRLARGAITSNGARAPSAAPSVKLNFGYAGCAKCLSRAMRCFLIVHTRVLGRTRQFSAMAGRERSSMYETTL